jgi:hypothetical protein
MSMLLSLVATATLLAAQPPPEAPDRYAMSGSLTPVPGLSVDNRFAIQASARLRVPELPGVPANARFSMKSLNGSIGCGAVGDILFLNGFE